MVMHIGQHIIMDAWQVPSDLLNDPDFIRQTLTDAIQVGQATLIDMCVHKFSPHGVTATATLAESHIAIHTWPEHGYFAADFFFCGAGNPKAAMEHMQKAFEAKKVRFSDLKRGFEPADTAVKLKEVVNG